MNSASAICAFVRCRAIRARISASRVVISAPMTGPTVLTPSSVPPAVRTVLRCPRSVAGTDELPSRYGEPGLQTTPAADGVNLLLGKRPGRRAARVLVQVRDGAAGRIPEGL